MKLRRIIATILTGTLITAGFVGCGASATSENDEVKAASNKSTSTAASSSTSDEKLIKLRVAADSAAFSSQYRIAKEEGFFEKYGIDATVDTFSWGIDTLNAVVLGQEDIGEAYDYATATRLGGDSKLEVIASNTIEKGDSNTLFANDPSINSVKDLVGKKIAVQKGTANEYTWAKTFEKYGVDRNKVKYVPLSSNAEILAAYQSKNVDAAWFGLDVKDKVEKFDGTHKLIGNGDLNQRGVGYIVVSQDFAKKNPETVKNILLALNEASEFIKNNRDQAIKDVSSSLGIPEENIEKTIDTLDYRVELKQTDIDHLSDIAEWSIENGLIEDKYEIDDYIDKDSIKQALPDSVDY